MRTFDWLFMQNLCNRPDIRPSLGGGLEPLALEATVMNPNNYTFKAEYGGFIVMKIFDGVYEAHTVFAPEKRGVLEVVKLMNMAQDYMFVHTDCRLLITKVPEGHNGARWLAKRGNFVFHNVQRKWDAGKSADIMHLNIDTWARVCYGAAEVGRRFHAMLEERKRAIHSDLPIHTDDDLHDRMAGAAVMLAEAGNLVKGVDLYNEWAVQYGYRPIVIVSAQPAVVDIGDALMGVQNGKLEVLLCR